MSPNKTTPAPLARARWRKHQRQVSSDKKGSGVAANKKDNNAAAEWLAVEEKRHGKPR
jgi:hypothetical protein